MLIALVLANLKLIYRDKQAGFWAIAFPLIFLLIFGLFNYDDLEPLLRMQSLGTQGKPVGYFDFLMPQLAITMVNLLQTPAACYRRFFLKINYF